MNCDEIMTYYGPRRHMQLREGMKKIYFSPAEIEEMTEQLFAYVDEKKFRLYHDMMDDIVETHPDWYNMLVFDSKRRYLFLEYIRSKVAQK